MSVCVWFCGSAPLGEVFPNAKKEKEKNNKNNFAPLPHFFLPPPPKKTKQKNAQIFWTPNFFLDQEKNKTKNPTLSFFLLFMAMVILSASVKRFSVSCIWDFYFLINKQAAEADLFRCNSTNQTF